MDNFGRSCQRRKVHGGQCSRRSSVLRCAALVRSIHHSRNGLSRATFLRAFTYFEAKLLIWIKSHRTFLAVTIADASKARDAPLILENSFALRISVNSFTQFVSLRTAGSSRKAVSHSGYFQAP